MDSNFSGLNLRGKNFKAQDLAGADFSNADIRGTKFTNSILTGANFTRAIAGIKPANRNILVLLCLGVSIALGFIAANGGGYAIQRLNANLLERTTQFLIVGTIGLVLFSIFALLSIRKGTIVAVVFLIVAIIVGAGLAVLLTIISSEIAVSKTFSEILASGLAVAASAGAISLIGALATVVVVAALSARVGAIANAVGLVGSTIIAISTSKTVMGVNSPLQACQIPAQGAELAVIVASGAISIMGSSLSGYLSWRTVAGDSQQSLIRTLAIAIANWGSTSFRNANLTDADFSEATLKNADLREATLIRTCWYRAKKLDFAALENTYLKKPLIRDLVISGDGENGDFDYQDFRGLNLSQANLTNASLIGTVLYQSNLVGANLSRAKLVRTQLEQVNLTGAILTGACIQDWAIAKTTKLDDIVCECVFMKFIDGDKRDPRPPKGEFKQGEFINFVSSILDTIELYHEENFDPRAAVIILKHLAEEYQQDLQLNGLRKLDNGAIALQVKISNSTDEEQFREKYYQLYPEALALGNEQRSQLLMGDAARIVDAIVAKLQENQSSTYNINLTNSTITGGINIVDGINNTLRLNSDAE